MFFRLILQWRPNFYRKRHNHSTDTTDRKDIILQPGQHQYTNPFDGPHPNAPPQLVSKITVLNSGYPDSTL